MLNVDPYRGTTAGQLAETIRRFGFELKPTDERPNAILAQHRESGLEIFLHADENLDEMPATVFGVRQELSFAEIADGATFDAVLAEVKKMRAHS